MCRCNKNRIILSWLGLWKLPAKDLFLPPEDIPAEALAVLGRQELTSFLLACCVCHTPYSLCAMANLHGILLCVLLESARLPGSVLQGWEAGSFWHDVACIAGTFFVLPA